MAVINSVFVKGSGKWLTLTMALAYYAMELIMNRKSSMILASGHYEKLSVIFKKSY